MDPLLTLSQNGTSRKLIQALGLPIPLPPTLRREKAGWRARLLDDVTVSVGAAPNPELLPQLARTLAPAGARVLWAGQAGLQRDFERGAEAWASPVRVDSARVDGVNSAGAPKHKVHALIFDATGLSSTHQLESLFDYFSPRLASLSTGGRVVVLTRPAEGASPDTNAARQAIEGFTRSLAKELGRRGSTANLIQVEPGVEDRIAGPLRFFLSGYSAFVTAQPLRVSRLAEVAQVDALDCYQSLRGKVALVTGGSRGIGEQTATCLAREGAHVVILDRPGEETAASRLARKLNGSMLLLDVAATGASLELDRFLKEGGPGRKPGLDILVHNAGLTRDKTLARMPKDAWDSVLNVNLNAVVQVTQAVLNESLLHENGRVIVLSSVGGIAGNVGQTNYAASKAGLIGYVRSLAPALAARGVTVNAVAPGFIETQMTARMPLAIREAARRLSALNQGGQPRDVAEVVTFLSMPWSHGVTSNVLRVCGGALIGA